MTVAVEVDYLTRRRIGLEPARAFLADLDEGPYVAEPLSAATLARAREIDLRYADANLGLVDASVVATAELIHADAIFTLDHGHFRLAAHDIDLLPS